jgi:hypothetical protein
LGELRLFWSCAFCYLTCLLLPLLLLQAALGLYYMHIGKAGGQGGGKGVSIGEAWDSWSWLQVQLQCTLVMRHLACSEANYIFQEVCCVCAACSRAGILCR